MEQLVHRPSPLPLFLEDHLRSSPSAPPPAPPPASAILQSWSALRRPAADVAAAVAFLSSHRRHLHLSPSHVSLLLSLLPRHPSHAALLLSAHFLRSPPSRTLQLPSLPPSPHSLLLLGASGDADRLCAFLDDNLNAVVSAARQDGLLPEALAGIGYALASSGDRHLRKILELLFKVWDCRDGCNPPGAEDGNLVFRLMEWVVVKWVQVGRMEAAELLCDAVSVETCKEAEFPLFAVVMACCGALRAGGLVLKQYRVGFHPRVGESFERTVSFVARRAVSDVHARVLVQCVALGLAQCGQVTFDPSIIRCVCSALFGEALPLPELVRSSCSSDATVVERVKRHQESLIFKEAGAVARVLCNHYSSSDAESKGFVEDQLWNYSLEMYRALRVAAFCHRERNASLLVELENIAEAAFLIVVVLAAEVSKHKLNSNCSSETRIGVAVKILVAFSCIEYMRRVRLPEYTKVVRLAVLTVQENAAACILFVDSMPSYAELTEPSDMMLTEGKNYIWSKDDVQTARMSFYLRVLPVIVSLVPASVFAQKVAAMMFLYMQHTNGKVTQAAHSVIASFVSSSNDKDHDERLNLKERLVFYYLRRSMEEFPGVTPFDGVASGITALAQNLAAGSPAMLFCIDQLVEKANHLCKAASERDGTLWSSWEGSIEPCKKVTDLLMHLVFLVDIQSLPYLLKRLAEFMAEMPPEGKEVLLDGMHARVAESDDVTRKPVLVSWLQSLSYIISHL